MYSSALAIGMFVTFALLTIKMVGTGWMLLFPLAVAVSTSFVWSTSASTKWQWVALCVAGPTVLTFVLFAIGGDWQAGDWRSLVANGASALGTGN